MPYTCISVYSSECMYSGVYASGFPLGMLSGGGGGGGGRPKEVGGVLPQNFFKTKMTDKY